MQLSEVCAAVVLDQVEVGADGSSGFRTAFFARLQESWTVASSLSLSQRHVSQETSLGRSILLEQQPSLASAAWSKISSSLHVGDSSHSLLLPLQIAGFSLTLRIVLYMESFLVLGNY
jgi:hypothetical protein